MKQIIDDYSPILEGVDIEELKEKVKEETETNRKSNIKINCGSFWLPQYF